MNFWFLFGVQAYWFFFFKIQNRAFSLLGSVQDHWWYGRRFDITFGLVASIKMLLMWYKIWEKNTIDVFFLDREKQKRDIKEMPNAWRTLFLANEFNEILITRNISIEVTIICFNFFMVGEGWQYTGLHEPNMNYHHQANVPLNYMLLFFLTTIVIATIGFL